MLSAGRFALFFFLFVLRKELACGWCFVFLLFCFFAFFAFCF